MGSVPILASIFAQQRFVNDFRDLQRLFSISSDGFFFGLDVGVGMGDVNICAEQDI